MKSITADNFNSIVILLSNQGYVRHWMNYIYKQKEPLLHGRQFMALKMLDYDLKEVAKYDELIQLGFEYDENLKGFVIERDMESKERKINHLLHYRSKQQLAEKLLSLKEVIDSI